MIVRKNMLKRTASFKKRIIKPRKNIDKKKLINILSKTKIPKMVIKILLSKKPTSKKEILLINNSLSKEQMLSIFQAYREISIHFYPSLTHPFVNIEELLQINVAKQHGFIK